MNDSEPTPSDQSDPFDNSKAPKSSWWRLLESSGGTALITVLLGSVGGAWISGIIQNGQKDREFQQSWLKARGDQALVAYKDYLDKQQDIVKRVYERIGTSISASDDLISLSRPEFALPHSESEQKVKMRKYREEIREKYNTSEREWRNEQETLGFLVDYYYPKQNNVLTAWQELAERVTAYYSCANQWLKDHPITDESDSACKQEKEAFSSSLNELTKALEEHRTYAWEGWESPKDLKLALEKKD